MCRGRPPQREAGLTTLELLVALAIVGALIAAGTLLLRPPAATLFASELRALVQQARLEAVKRNAPVAVVFEASGGRFVTRADPAAGGCVGGVTLAERRVSDHPRVTLTTELSDGGGLLWLPSGLARACDLSALTPTIATLDDGRTVRTLSITATGRVIVE
jgi:Tfp pilus assembly protein FimT